jgi:hypothetical protein
VLVDGDDHNEPVADAVRGILDGHIVMERAIAERGRYPAINILKSISRTMPRAADPFYLPSINRARQVMATYADISGLEHTGLAPVRTSMRPSPCTSRWRRFCPNLRKSQRLWRRGTSGWSEFSGAKKHKTNVIGAQSPEWSRMWGRGPGGSPAAAANSGLRGVSSR